MLECNYFTMLLKPSYERPIDSAKDVLDRLIKIFLFYQIFFSLNQNIFRGLTVFNPPGREGIVEDMKNSPYENTRALAYKTVVANDWIGFNKMIHDTAENGSSVVVTSYLMRNQLARGKWHRSKNRMIGQHPYGSFLMNKKWTLEEEFSMHMLIFQQVILS